MSRSRRNRSTSAAAWLPLGCLLLLTGLAAQGCKKAEPPAPEAPPVTAAEAEAPTPPPAASPAGEEITIVGRMPIEWLEREVKVGPGDTILWRIEKGKHGLRFPVQADCDLALATMTFDPPLTARPAGGCESGTKSTAGDLIVSAKVNVALARDLPYDCVIHGDNMPGLLQPK